MYDPIETRPIGTGEKIVGLILIALMVSVFVSVCLALKANADGKSWTLSDSRHADDVTVTKIQDGGTINCYVAAAQQSGGQGWTGTSVAISCLKVK